MIEYKNAVGGEICFALSGKHEAFAPSETLLEAVLNAGIWIDSSCQQGVCGNCEVKMTHGEVDMLELGGLPDDERAEGIILAGCSRPQGVIYLKA